MSWLVGKASAHSTLWFCAPQVIHTHFALHARTVIEIARTWVSNIVHSGDVVKKNTSDAVRDG
jgi:hypothetical protein